MSTRHFYLIFLFTVITTYAQTDTGSLKPKTDTLGSDSMTVRVAEIKEGYKSDSLSYYKGNALSKQKSIDIWLKRIFTKNKTNDTVKNHKGPRGRP